MDGEKSTSIEMQNTTNLYPIISGEISGHDTVAQPCDTRVNSSSQDIDDTNSEKEMLRTQPIKVFK